MSTERLPDGPDRTVVWTDEHDEGAPSNLAPAFDRFVPHPVYAKQRWISVLNPSHSTVRATLMPLISDGHARLATRRSRHGRDASLPPA